MWWAAFRRGMSDLGYVEGETVRYEARFAHSEFSRLPALADEIVRLNPDVIVTAATEATQAAQQATERIPIVTGSGSDHVSRGFAKSLHGVPDIDEIARIQAGFPSPQPRSRDVR